MAVSSYHTHKRKGVSIISDPDDPNALPIGYEGVNRLANSEKEPFLQTWLFFGLLSEFFGGNTFKEHDSAQPNQILFLYLR
jgi:hypothetical protein